jgi:uncharacterized membrane protein
VPLAFSLPAAALFAAAFLLRDDRMANRYHYPRSLWVAGGVIAFVLLNVEIADAYSTGRTIGFHMGASLGEDMTYSLGWGVFALVTLVLGMRFRSSRVRMCAIGVLLLTIGKVFLHDLWHLGALCASVRWVGLAVALPARLVSHAAFHLARGSIVSRCLALRPSCRFSWGWGHELLDLSVLRGG